MSSQQELLVAWKTCCKTLNGLYADIDTELGKIDPDYTQIELYLDSINTTLDEIQVLVDEIKLLTESIAEFESVARDPIECGVDIILFPSLTEGSNGGQAFYILNSGGKDLAVSSLVISGADASKFNLTPPTPATPFTILPGGEQRIQFSTNSNMGDALSGWMANIAVNSNSSENPACNFTLIQAVSSALELKTEIDGVLDCGDSYVIPSTADPAPGTRDFKIENIGFVPLDINSLILTGPDAAKFSIVSPGTPFTIAGQSNEVITIDTDTTGAVGTTLTATLTINSTSGNTPCTLSLSQDVT
jgi:hypothetical protein